MEASENWYWAWTRVWLWLVVYHDPRLPMFLVSVWGHVCSGPRDSKAWRDWLVFYVFLCNWNPLRSIDFHDFFLIPKISFVCQALLGTDEVAVKRWKLRPLKPRPMRTCRSQLCWGHNSRPKLVTRGKQVDFIRHLSFVMFLRTRKVAKSTNHNKLTNPKGNDDLILRLGIQPGQLGTHWCRQTTVHWIYSQAGFRYF